MSDIVFVLASQLRSEWQSTYHASRRCPILVGRAQGSPLAEIHRKKVETWHACDRCIRWGERSS